MSHTVSPFIVSSPGKVILFGDHSAVYGKPAIAAALSMRAYLLVTPSKDNDTIRLEFPDIDLSFSWNINDIPWESIKEFVTYEEEKPKPTANLVPEIVDKLSPLLDECTSDFHYTACLSFLYLYVNLCLKETPGTTFCVRSTVPIGAGLGSSASTSVCLATGLGLLGGSIPAPKLNVNDRVNSGEIPELEAIDAWSLLAEKTFHGNPSGIDNAVATHGGAVMYQRVINPVKPSIRTTMRNFPPLKLLLTNTKVPRSTANLVGNVSKLNSQYSTITSPILEAMGNIANQAYQLMIKPVFGDETKGILKDLININHGLLVSLGVSHTALERVKIICDNHGLGATKLTGAGGGGCAITLVNEELDESIVKQGISELEDNGFVSYETALGGKGVGVLFSQGEDELFSLTRFENYQSREEIEDSLSITKVDNWKFW